MGANKAFMTKEWVLHHYRLIIWGIAAYMRSFHYLETGDWMSKGKQFLIPECFLVDFYGRNRSESTFTSLRC
jgi:hypothetical protein